MENKELANIDYTKSSLEEEYYRCTFKNCNFSGMRIGKVLFEQCRFEHCNLSRRSSMQRTEQGAQQQCSSVFGMGKDSLQWFFFILYV